MSIDTGGFNTQFVDLTWEASYRERIAAQHPKLNKKSKKKTGQAARKERKANLVQILTGKN